MPLGGFAFVLLLCFFRCKLWPIFRKRGAFFAGPVAFVGCVRYITPPTLHSSAALRALRVFNPFMRHFRPISTRSRCCVVAINDHLNYICARKVYKNSLPGWAAAHLGGWCPKKKVLEKIDITLTLDRAAFFLIFPHSFRP